MSDNYTIKELRQWVKELGEFLAEHPEVRAKWNMSDTDELILSEGNKAMGIGWRLHKTGHGSLHTSVTSPSYLGATKQEAATSLMAVRREGYLVAELLKGN